MSFLLQLSFGKYQTDEQGWVDTIKSVGNGSTIRISTMDWLGQSQYTKGTVYWASLSSALSEVGSIVLKLCLNYTSMYIFFQVCLSNTKSLVPSLVDCMYNFDLHRTKTT